MKLALSVLTVLFVLLTEAACTRLENPLPSTQIPVEGETVGQTEAFSNGPAVCSCPTTVAATPPTGIIQPPAVICNCPAILVQPTGQTTQVGSTPQTIPTTGITLADSGKTFILHPGERFLLNLGLEQYNWSVSVDDQNVLSRVPNILVIRGAQGVYEARNPGQANLTATGNPACRNLTPKCMIPSLIFRIIVIVQE